MSDITERLDELYRQHGTNYVQEAAREIRNLRLENHRLRVQLEIARQWAVTAIAKSESPPAAK